MNTKKVVSNAIQVVVDDFNKCPDKYFTEEDIRWRLMREIEDQLSDEDKQLIHAEYPTPFRCSMEKRSFELLPPESSNGTRGHFDIVVLNEAAVRNCEFDIKRAQDYKKFLKQLLGNKLPLPFLNCAIEIKLFRERIMSKNTGPAKTRMQELANQSLQKVAAAFKAPEYYSKPFAKYGVVLVFNASEFNDGEEAPDRISCVWMTSTATQG
jgi:hypothetical protein